MKTRSKIVFTAFIINIISVGSKIYFTQHIPNFTYDYPKAVSVLLFFILLGSSIVLTSSFYDMVQIIYKEYKEFQSRNQSYQSDILDDHMIKNKN